METNNSVNNLIFFDLSYSNENWIYKQILEYTDIPQNFNKRKYTKEKAKTLYSWVNTKATNDSEEGRSMAEITKAMKPV